jgi:hypothetical protein
MWRLSLPAIFPSGRLGCPGFKTGVQVLPATPGATRQAMGRSNQAWGARLQPLQQRCGGDREVAAPNARLQHRAPSCNRERDGAAATVAAAKARQPCILYSIPMTKALKK